MKQLMSDPNLNLKVILLTRDPRGVFNSRGSVLVSNWCTDDDCASPYNECRDLLQVKNEETYSYIFYKRSFLNNSCDFMQFRTLLT